MAEEAVAAATRIAAGDDAAARGGRYDGMAMTLHWLTALLVVVQFGLAQVWDWVAKPTAHALGSLHVSLGVLLAAVLTLRLVWRIAFGRRLPPADSGWVEWAARGLHYVLYALLIVMVLAGFGKVWSRGHAPSFFGLIAVPAPVALGPAWRPALDNVHLWGAWTLIVLAALHMLAALYHHFVLHDGVLRRMLPGPRAPLAH